MKISLEIGAFPPSLSVHSRFSAIAARLGGATAVACGGVRLSYADLDEISSRISARLRRAGVRKGSVVGLIARRSPESTAAILGILKAGGAYLPLDLSYPPELLAHICRDSGLTLALVEEFVGAGAPVSSFWSGRTLSIRLPEGLVDPLEPDGMPESESTTDERQPSVGSEDLAYIMYTSGSTGRPKGVMVPHRGILRLVSECKFARLGPDEVILHLAPLSFDASTFELWGALLNGGRLAIIPTPHPSLDEIADAIKVNGATTLWLTAGLFHLMVENRLDGLSPLRQLLVGGDVLSPPHVARALKALPSCRIINGYGPTENTTFTCCYPIPRDASASEPIPIGSAIQGTTVHVLDGDMRPVPVGEEGELYAGGAGLALGYLNQPELTAEKFVEDPFTGTRGARLYRTGDRVRQRPDGTVEFLGRVDRQIKLNGKRIELDAVEAELRAEQGVQDAAAIACEDSHGRRSLVGFVTPIGLDPQALRRSLGARLPDFMVPASITALKSLPLSANGKVDRKRLVEFETPVAAGPAPKSVPPEGATRARLWRIVAQVLGRDAIGIEDNFFDLGASSLDIIGIHSKIVEAFGPVMTAVDLFGCANIKAVAARIDGGAAETTAFISASERARKRADALRRAQRVAAGNR